MNRRVLGAIVFLGFLCCASLSATLVPIGQISLTGQGLGAVNTSVTFQNTGTESGCVGSNSAGTAIPPSGSGVFVGPAECPAGISGGNEGTGNGQSNLFTATQLGIQSGNINGFSFANLVLLFNGNEGGVPADQNISLDKLALDLFSSSGTLLGTFGTAGANAFTAFPGVGSAGFAFQLDAAEALQANALLLANPNLLIATAATASLAQGGAETISLSTIPRVQSIVPEPRAGALILSMLIVAMLAFRKRVLAHGRS